MNINKAAEVTNQSIPTPKTGTSADAGKVAGKAVSAGTDQGRVTSKLIDRLNAASTESRQTLVNEVKARFQAGEFNTRESAESTADSILNQ